MKKYIPNALTTLRLLLVPLFIILIISNEEYSYHYALIVFIFASLTDVLDGKLARKFNVESRFGAFFDPLADKILILTAFVLFLNLEELNEIVMPWMVFLILFRDLSVTALRVFIKSRGLSMVTSKIAKLKTAFQLISITIILWLLSFYPGYLFDNAIIKLLMFIVTLFTVSTGIDYYYKNLRLILSKDKCT